MFAENSFKDKTVLVTGAGRGLGRALVKKLDALGATVYAVSRTPANLESLKSESDSGRIHTISVDLTDWTVTRETIQKIPPVNALVNNLGDNDCVTFMEAKKEDFERMFQINLFPTVNVSQIVAKKMIENGGGGSIVNISTIGALRMFPLIATYGTAKAALDFVSKTMAMELGPHNIRVNSVHPGFFPSELMDKVIGAFKASRSEEEDARQMVIFLSRSPLRKAVMDIDSVVNTVLFYASDLAGDVTGTLIPVDAGFTNF